MIVVVADTGPILHLHEVEALELLSHLGEVHIVPEVWRELTLHAPQLISATMPSWMKRVHLPPYVAAKASAWIERGLLHAGEADALAYAQAVGADVFLTDDTAARSAAETSNLRVRGSLGVVLHCAENTDLTYAEARYHLTALTQRSTLWSSRATVRKAFLMLESLQM